MRSCATPKTGVVEQRDGAPTRLRARAPRSRHSPVACVATVSCEGEPCRGGREENEKAGAISHRARLFTCTRPIRPESRGAPGARERQRSSGGQEQDAEDQQRTRLTTGERQLRAGRRQHGRGGHDRTGGGGRTLAVLGRARGRGDHRRTGDLRVSSSARRARGRRALDGRGRRAPASWWSSWWSSTCWSVVDVVVRRAARQLGRGVVVQVDVVGACIVVVEQPHVVVVERQ